MQPFYESECKPEAKSGGCLSVAQVARSNWAATCLTVQQVRLLKTPGLVGVHTSTRVLWPTLSGSLEHLKVFEGLGDCTRCPVCLQTEARLLCSACAFSHSHQQLHVVSFEDILHFL